MKINYSEGCMNPGLIIDNKFNPYWEDSDEEYEGLYKSMPISQLKKIAEAMLSLSEDRDTLCEVIRQVVQDVGEYKDYGQCGQCGDWISEWTYELPLECGDFGKMVKSLPADTIFESIFGKCLFEEEDEYGYLSWIVPSRNNFDFMTDSDGKLVIPSLTEQNPDGTIPYFGNANIVAVWLKHSYGEDTND